MHKATLLEATLHFAIQPEGPILIKAGESGADPTRPNMEFVRTKRNGAEQIYLPGASLKGVVRSHCERICRSLDGESRRQKAREHAHSDDKGFVPPLADNPMGDKTNPEDDVTFSSNAYFNDLAKERQNYTDEEKERYTALVYRRSSFTSQLFGHTSLASRIRFADAYVKDGKNPEIETRNGVAIDRIYGSTIPGALFEYEVAVSGAFATRIDFKNITLAQLALVGLALRDLNEGRVAIGFGKSRGLGRVSLELTSLTIRYPVCMLQNGVLSLMQNKAKVVSETDHFAGVGALTQATGGFDDYRFTKDDTAILPAGVALQEDEFMGVSFTASEQEQIYAIWRACMPCWREVVDL
ncbi:MAG: hypothetical protein GFH27_549285n30 [Chloroflexi bacterium AL-W]|nr:hypothetical protein [Chloroflexi bacterium AL-N1]NOK65542.1 hypothetical protein [Chloroflexi bacterium AL-N10]NOK74516.1 hypothetical protein [Chloroflexi bacterium AL-N5]NOK80575.1 hypothetical protein [Chloroflexi bacterium AL-W]NOK88774.1 hypothetical protein [Chloroflexi bacterium AL-N15]